MELDVFAFHVALSLLMFLVLNWIGRHAQSSGYVTLSLFVKQDEAPAFNLLFRIFGPIIFVILTASALYSLGLDKFVYQIWLVVFYYYVERFLYIVSFRRVLLVNWAREFSLLVGSVGLTWLLYDQVIQFKKNLLPDVTHINNNLWMLIVLFLYSVLNNLRFDQDATKRRKNRYLYGAYSDNTRLYGETVTSLSPDRLAESIILSILIYETFNRPPVARLVERLVFPWWSKSLGPMQVVTNRRISDIESVKLGCRKVIEDYARVVADARNRAKEKSKSFDPEGNHYHQMFVVSKVAAAYNKDDSYVSEIRELHELITREFYRELNPPPAPHSDSFI